jgi:hypothetical protein
MGGRRHASHHCDSLPGGLPQVTLTFRIASDGFLWGTYESKVENARTARITLERIS